MKPLDLAVLAASVLSFSTLCSVATPVTQDYADKNLALVPATDPAATNTPQLVDTMKGVHPRLLFTARDMEALKAQIPTDPILQKSY